MNRALLILSFLLLGVGTRAEMMLKVNPLSGGEEQYAVSLIGQIRFAGEVMYLYDAAGIELGHTAVADINKIIFKDNSATSFQEVVPTGVAIWPNPAQEILRVSGLTDEQTIRVYSMDGRMMMAEKTNNGEAAIRVGGLQTGTYLLQIGAEVVKFIKK